MSYQRTRRIEEEIRKSLSHILIEQIKDPRIVELVSIVRVELSKDIKYAKIFVSVFGGKTEKETAMEGLTKASGFIRKELASDLKLKNVPEIHFKLDSSIEHSIAVARIIKKLSQEKREATNDPS